MSLLDKLQQRIDNLIKEAEAKGYKKIELRDRGVSISGIKMLGKHCAGKGWYLTSACGYHGERELVGCSDAGDDSDWTDIYLEKLSKEA